MKSYQEFVAEFHKKLNTYKKRGGFIDYDSEDLITDLIKEHFSNVLKEYESELSMKKLEILMLKGENEEWRKVHNDEIKDNFVKNPVTGDWTYTATPNLKPHRKGLGLSKFFK